MIPKEALEKILPRNCCRGKSRRYLSDFRQNFISYNIPRNIKHATYLSFMNIKVYDMA